MPQLRSALQAASSASGERPPPPGGRSLGLLSKILGFRFRRIQNHLSSGLMQAPAFQGGKPGGLSALALIQANPGLSQIELSNEIGLDKAQIVVLLDELEQNGWARRERARADRRRNRLFVTPSGKAKLAYWMEIARENERVVREALTAEEFELLSALLDRIYNQCFNKLEG